LTQNETPFHLDSKQFYFSRDFLPVVVVVQTLLLQ